MFLGDWKNKRHLRGEVRGGFSSSVVQSRAGAEKSPSEGHYQWSLSQELPRHGGAVDNNVEYLVCPLEITNRDGYKCR